MATLEERRATDTSTVASCGATDCVYNHDHECHAGAIRVEAGGQGAICGTYDPRRAPTR